MIDRRLLLSKSDGIGVLIEDDVRGSKGQISIMLSIAKQHVAYYKRSFAALRMTPMAGWPPREGLDLGELSRSDKQGSSMSDT